MSTLRHGAGNSYRFKHYCLETDPKTERQQRHHTTHISESILELIDAASESAQEVENFLNCAKTIAHLNSGKTPPRTMDRRIRKMCGKLQSASLCFNRGLADTLNEPTLTSLLEQLSHMADDILSLLDSMEVFLLNPQVNLSEVLRRRVRWIVNHIEQARLQITPHTKVAAPVAPPEEIEPIITQSPSPVLFPEEEVTDPSLGAFLEKAERRGWTVTKTMKNALKQAGVIPMEDDPGLEASFELLNDLQSYDCAFLSDDTEIGVSQLPIISYNMKRPPDSIIQKFLSPRIGYDLYLIFGSYIVVDQMCLLGIHKDLVWTQDEKNKPQLDTDKFYSLYPSAANELQQWTGILRQTYPVQPARRAGNHYYCPLVPNAVLNSWSHGLGDWDFLTA